MRHYTCHVIHINMTNEQPRRWWRQAWHTDIDLPWCGGQPYQFVRAVRDLTLEMMDGTQRLIMLYTTPYNPELAPGSVDSSFAYDCYPWFGRRSDQFGWGYLPRNWELRLTKFPELGRTVSTTFPYAVTFQDVRGDIQGGYKLKAKSENPDRVALAQSRWNSVWNFYSPTFLIPRVGAVYGSPAKWHKVDHCTLDSVHNRKVDFYIDNCKSLQGYAILEWVRAALFWTSETLNAAIVAAYLSGNPVHVSKVQECITMSDTARDRCQTVGSFLTGDYGAPIWRTRVRRMNQEPFLAHLQLFATGAGEYFNIFKEECNQKIAAYGTWIPQSVLQPVVEKSWKLGAAVAPIAFGRYGVQPAYLGLTSPEE